MAYVERKLKKHIGSSNPINIILKVCQCCLWCFEKCMKFLNRNAYIEVAIYGYNFCKAARKAFSLLARLELFCKKFKILSVVCLRVLISNSFVSVIF